MREWTQYESDRWREAIDAHGLALSSLDPEEQRLVVEAMRRDTMRKAIEARDRLRAARRLLAQIP